MYTQTIYAHTHAYTHLKALKGGWRLSYSAENTQRVATRYVAI